MVQDVPQASGNPARVVSMSLQSDLQTAAKIRRTKPGGMDWKSEKPFEPPPKFRDYAPLQPVGYIKPITYEQGQNLTRRVLRVVETSLQLRLSQNYRSLEQILNGVCKHYRVSLMDITSARRTANVVRPRQVVMYLATKANLTNLSLPETGRRLGGRDHTTVLHGARRIETLMKTDTILQSKVDCLRQEIIGAA